MRPAHVQAFSCMPQPPLPTAHRCRTRATSAAQTIETPKVFTSSVDSYPWEPRDGRAVLERAYRIQISRTATAMDIAMSPRPMEILLVEDDPDDAFLVQEMTSSGVSPVDVGGFRYRMLVGWWCLRKL